jgi:hypothetical protein
MTHVSSRREPQRAHPRVRPYKQCRYYLIKEHDCAQKIANALVCDFEKDIEGYRSKSTKRFLKSVTQRSRETKSRLHCCLALSVPWRFKYFLSDFQ